MKYNFSYDFTPDDIVAFRKHHFFRDKGMLVLFAFLSFVSLALLLDVISGTTYPDIRIFVALFWVILGCKFFSDKLLLKNEFNQSAFHQKNIEITEDYYICKCECVEQKLPWEKFLLYQENKDYFFLYYNSKSAILLPKNKAKPQEKFLEGLDFIRAKLNQSTPEGEIKKSTRPGNCFLSLIIVPILLSAIYYIFSKLN